MGLGRFVLLRVRETFRFEVGKGFLVGIVRLFVVFVRLYVGVYCCILEGWYGEEWRW